MSEFILMLILLILADTAKRLRSTRPLALAGSGMIQPWQAWELVRHQNHQRNIASWS